jgi:uncharacterized protein (DUF58 family)
MIPRELLKRVRQIEIAARRKVTTQFAGGYLSTFRGQGMEFDEVREYAPGDDIRNIDWNVTARAGHPFIKRFIVEREMCVLLVVDISGSLGFGSGEVSKSKLVTELATLLAFLAIGNGDRVGLLLASDRVEHFIPPGNGKKHLYRVIREMFTHQRQSTGTDLGAALDFACRMVPRHSTVFVVSDFLMPAEGLEKPVARLSKRHDAIAVSISDPREMEIPSMGLLRVTDPETGESVTVDSSDPVFQRDFSAAERQRRDAVWRLLTRHGIDRVPLSTAVSYMTPLMKFFHTRARRLR